MTAAVAALWSAAEARVATGGVGGGDWTASGVSIDSRTLAAGDLFVALRGPNFDAHDFLAQAFGKGAAAAIVATPPADRALAARCLRVDDTQRALEQLADAARQRSPARILAVTGSVGKTGSKEALRLALAAQAPTVASAGNLNNEIGAPLSLARLPRAARYGVFELGMNHPGELARLSQRVRPHVALITNVEAVHLEFFGSVEAIADAKAEIFAGMDADGIAVLNRDNAQFDRLAAAADRYGVRRVVSFGAADGADLRLVDCTLNPRGSDVTATCQGKTLRYTLPLPGRHWVQNSLGVLAAAAAAGADVAQAAAALAALAPIAGRGAPQAIDLGGGTVTLIDESYNAGPASMRAAIAVLGRAEVAAGGRRIAVLGDMLELGADGPALHVGLAGDLDAAGIDRVFCCGPLMDGLYAALPPARRGAYGADSAALAPQVCAALRPGDVVMVKGSLGSRMAVIVAALRALDQIGAKRAANDR